MITFRLQKYQLKALQNHQKHNDSERGVVGVFSVGDFGIGKHGDGHNQRNGQKYDTRA